MARGCRCREGSSLHDSRGRPLGGDEEQCRRRGTCRCDGCGTTWDSLRRRPRHTEEFRRRLLLTRILQRTSPQIRVQGKTRQAVSWRALLRPTTARGPSQEPRFLLRGVAYTCVHLCQPNRIQYWTAPPYLCFQKFLRVGTQSFPFGEACGHAALASNQPVIAAVLFAPPTTLLSTFYPTITFFASWYVRPA